MKPLDTLNFPLSGHSLIEASAGTGKTYTIVNLYLRLLLGHKCRPCSVEQILVVTFTNAATAELKERIRLRLRQAYLDFFAKASQDPFIQSLIEQIDDVELASQRLALASKQMDEAAIYTIHGFCHKALTEHAFESGAMYDQSFILDEREWLQLAVGDYWRKHIVTQSPAVVELLLKQWTTPAALLKAISTLLNREAVPFETQKISAALNSVERYVQAVTKIKHWWLDKGVSAQLAKANLNGRAKLGKPSLLHSMDEFCRTDLHQIDFDKGGWTVFFPEQIAKASKKGSEDLSHLDFSQFELLQSMMNRCQRDLVLAFTQQAIAAVSMNLRSHKERLQLLSPDDLLSGLQRAIRSTSHKNDANVLASTIRQSYPAALIDEFQDTDPVQFEVFKGIYADLSATSLMEPPACWIMIGDPKQAIYAFRGADIFTYITAKQWIDKERHYTLDTNWRSAPALVDAINILFTKSTKGFLFEDSIPFYSVAAGKNIDGLNVNGVAQPSLHFQHFCSKKHVAVTVTEAIAPQAAYTANQISHWLELAHKGQATVNGKALTAGDFCVLVRNRNEAQVVKQALSAVNVASVFLARKSVFATQIATDLYRLLKALSLPRDERLLKTALMCELFNKSADELDELFTNESAWQTLLEQCFHWHASWQKYGLMHALNQVLVYFDIEKGLVKYCEDGLRRVTDLRHLIELLQQKSLQLVGETQLIHWFESIILEPDHNSENQQMRLESDANLVQIITLHSSKGLEFPLVFIPFANAYKSTLDALYHNQKQHLEVDYLAEDSSIEKAEFERLAEDIRLFYVAVTRAIYYCSIGVWNCSLGKNKKQSGFQLSALGSLLMSAESRQQENTDNQVDNQYIAQRIQFLSANGDISYSSFSEIEVKGGNPVHDDSLTSELSTQSLAKPVRRGWMLTSYSAISSQQTHVDMPTPGLDEGIDQTFSETALDSVYSSLTDKNPFTFERGANAGSFLHGVLENIDFRKPEQLSDVIERQSAWYGIDASWQETVKNWLSDVLVSPFDKQKAGQELLCLSRLQPRQVKVEMEFYMPLRQVLVADFNFTINQHFTHHARDYQFEQLNGMIKGFIDLMFEFDGKYYVADYKSNHLGDTAEDYHFGALEHAMVEHDYHLQAILYTVALHRWLRHKLAGYDYQKHIGGAYYLFIRGMSRELPGNGVYHFLPNQKLIENLDKLFSGEAITNTSKDKVLVELSATERQGQLDLW